MHGGNLRRAKEIYGLESFVDLSANINPFGPPPGVWASIEKGMKDIVNYPDPESIGLRKSLATHFNQPFETIMVGNGAGELIFTIVQALKPRRVAIPIPTFSEYERAARAAGSEVQYIPLGPEGWAKYQTDKKGHLSEANCKQQIWKDVLKDCDLLFLCSPHNPTGTVLEKETFEEILEFCQEIGCRILFDESFVDFLPDAERWSARDYLTANEHLMVLYSLTKFYSLPGLRLGSVFAQPRLIADFEQYRDPWSVNVLAQHAGISALEDLKYPDEVRGKLQESREYFYREFQSAGFLNLKLWPTVVNFALIEVLDQPPEKLIEHLGRSGILVRNCASFTGLPGNFIRVAIKDISVMQRLIAELKSWIGLSCGNGILI
ncbi:threonine-phosphate decarboxylase CobD [Desulfosporosinus meridiei]|uniref:threonine-phosphate decarboxylase n=1 Tax=Desulfosporosinus meridiei (strain ATCC BAA-275 / DSM 13257 / KCTC 12902 / NCIMB 13706 / S10) TaxID=768704 RepID=J7IYF8_DESMD|nr:threonine-phosphate decarboxylase CobD [Desulfosporosinus meridiei]AFQ44138.1 L-threonine O-3-phosphate decarboxylase [Desulfosporosinus meridiei DSM 13257]